MCKIELIIHSSTSLQKCVTLFSMDICKHFVLRLRTQHVKLIACITSSGTMYMYIALWCSLNRLLSSEVKYEWFLAEKHRHNKHVILQLRVSVSFPRS